MGVNALIKCQINKKRINAKTEITKSQYDSGLLKLDCRTSRQRELEIRLLALEPLWMASHGPTGRLVVSANRDPILGPGDTAF